jgi:hypothetical protein
MSSSKPATPAVVSNKTLFNPFGTVTINNQTNTIDKNEKISITNNQV